MLGPSTAAITGTLILAQDVCETIFEILDFSLKPMKYTSSSRDKLQF